MMVGLRISLMKVTSEILYAGVFADEVPSIEVGRVC